MPYITFKDYPEKTYKCTTRLLRICHDNQIRRLADLSRLTVKDLMSLPECGEATAAQVEKMLRDNGLDFSEQFIHGDSIINTVRDNHIVELISHGESYRTVGRQFGISHARVAQIHKQYDDRVSGAGA